MRAYSTAVVATALGVNRRWLDALVAGSRIPGVQPDRQGKSRAIAPRTIVVIATAMELAEHLGASLPDALQLAGRLVDRGRHRPTPEITIEIDVASIERRVALRLADAVEANPPARRGRPPTGARSRNPGDELA